MNNCESIKYAGAPHQNRLLIRVNKLSFLLKNTTNNAITLFCMGRELIIQIARSLARVRSSLYFSLNDILFHPYPHDHFLTFPSLGSNPTECCFFYGSLCKWSSIAHYHHPSVLIWRKYCLKGRKNRVIYPPVPFHSKPGRIYYFILLSFNTFVVIPH